MSVLEQYLSPEEIETLKLNSLVEKIESGIYMPDYIDWLRKRVPDIRTDWKHVQYICDHLHKVVSGDIKRLMIFAPPQHGKSHLVTTTFPIYVLNKNPKSRIVIGAYNQTLANKFSVRNRSLADKLQLKVNKYRRARNEWELMAGGGVKAVGVGGGVTGYSADMIIIDDPIKGRKDADSETVRETTYNWYTTEIFTRLQQQAAIVIINTRWHYDDLSGRILENEGYYSADNPNGWHVVSLPALAEENDPLGRLPGEALCEERFTLQRLHAIRNVLGTRDFESLYQQRPGQSEGTFFKRDHFKFVDSIPKEEKNLRFARYWDFSASLNKGDYTVGALLAHSLDSKNTYIVDIKRFRLSTYERNQIVLKTAKEDIVDYGYGVRIYFEREPGSSGIDAADAIVRLLSGYSVKAIPSRTNKEIRARPFEAQVEAGTVYLVRGTWNKETIDEFTSFPSGKHDDIVDSVSGAYTQLVAGAGFIKVGSRT